MSFSSYLLSKSIPLCLVSLSGVLWAAFALLSGVNLVFVVLSACFVALFLVGWLLFGYFYARKRLARVERLIGEAEEGYLLGAILPRPVDAVEEEYFRIMSAVSSAAISRTEEAIRAQADYCEFVESWIHEIKTPLTAVSLILANGGDGRKLKSELKRAENLTETVLYYAKLRSPQIDTQISSVDLRAAADEAVKGEMPLLLAAWIRVEIEGELAAYTDRQAIVFCLKQLLVNSSKYCKGGKVSIRLEGNSICFEDDGEGIPPHEQKRVFSRGFVGEAGRAHGGGTGKGLYLVHGMCERLGIDLSLQSERGKYTRFVFSFPGEAILTKV